ncbi:hypothetical protein FA13DRAFT_1739259 [Coprinellus micaceus]|uniref:Uncharacterized protein n=1 Tax=Coprinellus micaceus TaxID=71717 RepID=A0A4Y7SRB5_COPMI|nr:hypothetical protein FA13DRAFT_1739259 [Coprinellus micaceus]
MAIPRRESNMYRARGGWRVKWKDVNWGEYTRRTNGHTAKQEQRTLTLKKSPLPRHYTTTHTQRFTQSSGGTLTMPIHRSTPLDPSRIALRRHRLRKHPVRLGILESFGAR